MTGVVGEGVERSKVPFAIGRLTAEDMPVPALDPVQALAGKVAGVRIGQIGGAPGTRRKSCFVVRTRSTRRAAASSPCSSSTAPSLNVGSYDELGGLDIESVEVVKGAAGASIYGATAANGVIVIKTKRGAIRTA